MKRTTHIIGVDPGIVHTGVVELNFYPEQREILSAHEVVIGTDAKAVKDWIYRAPSAPGDSPSDIFIEGYRPRSHLQHDKRMAEAVSEMRKATRGRVLDNTGIKTTVRPQLLQLLGVAKFTTPTHHQDLLSAARIAVLGMLKNDDHNRLLADIIRDHLNGSSWTITH